MEVAFECPTELLEDIQPLGDYYFTLTHLILKDPIYREYYKANRGKLLILDNSTNELGEPCSQDEILQCYWHLTPDIVVPPDYLGDMFRTLKALDTFWATLQEGSDCPKSGVLPVLQGSNSNECLTCSMFYRQRGFKQVAVPYDITCSKQNTLQFMARKRIEVVWRIAGEYDWVHLLGMTDPSEFSKYRGLPCRVTLDTGSPILHGLHSIHLSETERLFDKTRCSLDRMNHHESNLDMAKENIKWLKELVNGI